MGRFSRSWDLVQESFAILWADKQLMLFPVLSGISCLIVTLLVGVSGLAIFFAGDPGGGNHSAKLSAFHEIAGVRSGDVCFLSGELFCDCVF